MADHGTAAEYQQHKKRGERPCLECTDAYSQYMREYRARNPEYRRRNQDRQSARDRALRELGRRHPEELQQLIREESD